MNQTPAYCAITTVCSTLDLPKAFMSDVYRHDNRTTAENPDLKFVWTIRDTGSNLFCRKASVSFWEPFLRDIERSGERIYIWDGAKLTATDPATAADFLFRFGV